MGCRLWGPHRVGDDWRDLAAAAALHPHGAGGGTGRKLFTWLQQGWGKGRGWDPQVPAIGRLLPTLGLEETGLVVSSEFSAGFSGDQKGLPAPSVLFFHLMRRPKAPLKGPARAGRRQPWGI